VAPRVPRGVHQDGLDLIRSQLGRVLEQVGELLVDASPLVDSPAFRRTLASVEAFPAVKLYLWYDRPWWRDHGEAIRLTTDLPPRKLFYFGRDPVRPAALLAAYTDGRDTEPWLELAAGERSVGSPVPQAMLDAAFSYLREIHPRVDPLPEPVGSAFSAWGTDPHETGWHYWRAGIRSDDVIASALQPVDGVDLYVCGEAFSRRSLGRARSVGRSGSLPADGL
jgi:monoamine oxidase